MSWSEPCYCPLCDFSFNSDTPDCKCPKCGQIRWLYDSKEIAMKHIDDWKQLK